MTERDLAKVRDYVSTVGDEARCYLATQHQVVVGSILEKFGDDVAGHVGTAGRGTPRAATPDIVAELVDIAGDEAVVDTRFPQKQPDWTFDAEWSGKVPVERFEDHRAP